MVNRETLIAEGKTKRIFSFDKDPSFVRVQSKDAMTKHNDPAQTVDVPGKGELCNTVAVNIFRLLHTHGVPVAFVRPFSDDSFIAEHLDMLPLELIVRNEGTGSFLKRYPDASIDPTQQSVRFQDPIFELFLKTSNGGLSVNGREIVSGLTTDQDDPWIPHLNDKTWSLWDPKKSLNDPTGDLGKMVSPGDILGKISIREVEILALQVNAVLKLAFSKHDYRLIDFKIEAGINASGQLKLGDALDPDSWRVWDMTGQKAFDKQPFRDGVSAEEVLQGYLEIAAISACFS